MGNPRQPNRLVHAGLPVLLLLVVSEVPVEAYLDPGAGSLLVQLALGGVAAGAVFAKLLWHRLTLQFKRRDSDAEKP
jgi:hypothetical protein